MWATLEKHATRGLLLFYCISSSPPPISRLLQKPRPFPPPQVIFAVCVYGCKNMLFAMSAGVLGWKWRVVCAFSCFLGLLCGWVVKVSGVGEMGKGVGVCLVDLGTGREEEEEEEKEGMVGW